MLTLSRRHVLAGLAATPLWPALARSAPFSFPDRPLAPRRAAQFDGATMAGITGEVLRLVMRRLDPDPRHELRGRIALTGSDAWHFGVLPEAGMAAVPLLIRVRLSVALLLSRIDDAVGYSYQEDGHSFYQLTFPSANPRAAELRREWLVPAAEELAVRVAAIPGPRIGYELPFWPDGPDSARCNARHYGLSLRGQGECSAGSLRLGFACAVATRPAPRW